MTDDRRETTPGQFDASQDPVLAERNDPAALNGGPARHWFRRDAAEPLATPRRGVKLCVAITLWGLLLFGVLSMLAGLSR